MTQSFDLIRCNWLPISPYNDIASNSFISFRRGPTLSVAAWVGIHMQECQTLIALHVARRVVLPCPIGRILCNVNFQSEELCNQGSFLHRENFVVDWDINGDIFLSLRAWSPRQLTLTPLTVRPDLGCKRPLLLRSSTP